MVRGDLLLGGSYLQLLERVPLSVLKISLSSIIWCLLPQRSAAKNIRHRRIGHPRRQSLTIRNPEKRQKVKSEVHWQQALIHPFIILFTNLINYQLTHQHTGPRPYSFALSWINSDILLPSNSQSTFSILNLTFSPVFQAKALWVPKGSIQLPL